MTKYMDRVGMIQHYDVIVLGGGPAGLSAALTLREHAPQLSVGVVEPTGYESTRLGETLPPGVQAVLQQLGVWQAFQRQPQLEIVGTESSWGSTDFQPNDYLFGVNGSGWSLDRPGFDRLLRDAAVSKNVAIHHSTHWRDAEKAADGDWKMLLLRDSAKPSNKTTIYSRFVIDASGRKAAFARAQGSRPLLVDSLVAVHACFCLDNPAAQTLGSGRVIVEPFEHGWWYLVPLPGQRYVIACMTDSRIAKRKGLSQRDVWLGQLEQTKKLNTMINAGRWLSTTPEAPDDWGPFVYPAASRILDQAGGEGWLAAGDAMATFDPLSSQGITQAMRGGIFAAYACADCLAGKSGALEKYHQLFHTEYQAYLNVRSRYYQMESRWQQEPFWHARGERSKLTQLGRAF